MIVGAIFALIFGIVALMAFFVCVASLVAAVKNMVIHRRIKDDRGYGVEIKERNKSLVCTIISGPIAALLLSFGLGTLSPWFQPFFFKIFVEGSGFLLVTLIIVIASLLIGLIVRTIFKGGGAETGLAIFIIAFIGWCISWGVWCDNWVKEDIYQKTIYNNLSFLPDTSAVRYLPMEVAEQSALNRLQDPAVTLGDADPIIINDEVNWVISRVPNGFFNKCLRKADGFVMVSGIDNISTVRQEMKFGEGMYGTDGIEWRLKQERYWSKVTEIYYIQVEEEVIAVAPYLDYSFSFPVMVPEWGGVFLVHSDGRIENLTSEEAANSPLLVGARIFPESLARLEVEAYSYQKGIWNVMYGHDGQVEIPNMTETDENGFSNGNQMPFLLPTELGQKWFIATVPWGADGIYKIFFIDAITGSIDMFELPIDSALVGPDRAERYISNAYPYFDWDNYKVLEPRPIIREGELYWMFTITPETFTGVTDTVLVSAKTTTVISFGTDENELKKFIRGEQAGNVIGIGESTLPSEIPVTDVSGLSAEEIDEMIQQMESLIQQLESLKQSLNQSN